MASFACVQRFLIRQNRRMTHRRQERMYDIVFSPLSLDQYRVNHRFVDEDCVVASKCSSLSSLSSMFPSLRDQYRYLFDEAHVIPFVVNIYSHHLATAPLRNDKLRIKFS